MGNADEVDEGGFDDAGFDDAGEPGVRPAASGPGPGPAEAPVPFEGAVVHRDDDGRERPSPFVGWLSLITVVGLVALSAAAAGAVGYVVIQLVQALLG